MKSLKLMLTLLGAAGLWVLGCAKSGGDTREECQKVVDAGGLCGDITTNRTVGGAGQTIALLGAVRVKNGATLTILPGTTVKADTSQLSYLSIERGGKIIANGNASNPIVFTSGAARRRPSDWGGIVIHGRSATNTTSGQNFATNTEINTGPYGCGDAEFPCTGPNNLNNDDDSGVLRYVRLEFAGWEISAGKEFNGIFMAGVGKGTTVEYVQVHRGADDGIEIFGGAVDVRYAILTNNQDDQFDVDDGWRGTAQFVVAAVPFDGDQGIEYDGIGGDANRATNAVLSNFTIMGSRSKSYAGLIAVRDQGTMSLYNSYIAYGWGPFGVIAVDGSSAANAVNTPALGFGSSFDLRFESNYLECIYKTVGFSGAQVNTVNEIACTASSAGNCTATATLTSRFPDGSANNDIQTPASCAPNSTSVKLKRAPDNTLYGVTNGIAEFIPTSNITVTTYADPQPAPNGTDLPPATYIGAFAAGDTWANGWTAFPVN